MHTATIQTSVSGNVSGSYSKSYSVSAGGRVSIEEAIPDGSTDMKVALGLDVSQVKGFFLRANRDMTVETNDGTTPGNTFTLEADRPYLFPSSEGAGWSDTEDAAVSTDITALFVTNASGEDGTLYVDVIYDPTL